MLHLDHRDRRRHHHQGVPIQSLHCSHHHSSHQRRRLHLHYLVAGPELGLLPAVLQEYLLELQQGQCKYLLVPQCWLEVRWGMWEWLGFR